MSFFSKKLSSWKMSTSTESQGAAQQIFGSICLNRTIWGKCFQLGLFSGVFFQAKNIWEKSNFSLQILNSNLWDSCCICIFIYFPIVISFLFLMHSNVKLHFLSIKICKTNFCLFSKTILPMQPRVAKK